CGHWNGCLRAPLPPAQSFPALHRVNPVWIHRGAGAVIADVESRLAFFLRQTLGHHTYLVVVAIFPLQLPCEGILRLNGYDPCSEPKEHIRSDALVSAN